MAKDKNSSCNFNHSINTILFLMFFIVLIAVVFNDCLGTCSEKQKEQPERKEQILSEPSVNEAASRDSLVDN